MRIATLIFIFVFSVSVLAQSKQKTSELQQEMFNELAAKDRTLFDAIFNTCDTDNLTQLLTDDFEFYHDKFGQIANSGSGFVKDVKNMCERQEQGTDYRARRELVKNSVRVYPLNNYGAVQMGEHRFYKLMSGKKDELTEAAKFAHLWKKENGIWKLARVLSYDHRDPKGASLTQKVSAKH
jgi:hypothetical protein